MLKKFGMEECSPINTPMVIGCKLKKYDESLEVDQTMYRLIIGSLLYLAASRLHIMNIFGVVVRYQFDPNL